jgi:hypothetical protein
VVNVKDTNPPVTPIAVLPTPPARGVPAGTMTGEGGVMGGANVVRPFTEFARRAVISLLLSSGEETAASARTSTGTWSM